MKRHNLVTCAVSLLALIIVAGGCVVRHRPVHNGPPPPPEYQNPPPDYPPPPPPSEQYNTPPPYAPPPQPAYTPPPPPGRGHGYGHDKGHGKGHGYGHQKHDPPPPLPPPPSNRYAPPPSNRYAPPPVVPSIAVSLESTQVRRGAEIRLFLNRDVPVNVYFMGRLVTKKVNAADRRVLTVNVPTDAPSGYWEVEYNGQRARTATVTIHP